MPIECEPAKKKVGAGMVFWTYMYCILLDMYASFTLGPI